MADLEQLPNRDKVLSEEPNEAGLMQWRWLQWLDQLRDAVNRLIGGTFDGDATVAGNLTVTGAFSAASAAITGAITATSALISTSIVAASAVFIGAVTAASATISGLLTLTGGQIQFPATQVASADANTLDDYEENVFTPTSPNISYTTAGANYQKIGSWVYITGFVVFPVTGDGNAAAINNLPFTCENSSQARGGGVCHFSNLGALVALLVTNNTTTAAFVVPSTGAGYSNAALSNVTLFFNFSYRATA